HQKFPLFKTALSDPVEHDDEEVIFVAISSVEKDDMLANNKLTNHGRTIIYRMVKEVNKYKKEVYQICEKGGIIRFAHSDTILKSSLFTKESSRVEKIKCFLFNAKGIFRYTYSSK